MGGAGAAAGTGAGNAKKDTPPQAIDWGGAGKRAGGTRFSGPRPPRNELYFCLLSLFVSIQVLCRPLTWDWIHCA